MKMKSILLMLLSLCMVISLCACGGNSGEGTTQTTVDNNATTTAATTTTTVATTTTTTVSDKLTFTVKVTDEAGNPISGVPVQLCLVSCLPNRTNEEGIATWENMDEADYKVSFWQPLPTGYSSDVEEFYFEDGSYEMTIVLKAVA